MPAPDSEETLFPEVEVGSKITVWCLEFPPERRGNEIWTRLLEEVEVEIVEIEQQDHESDDKTKELMARLEAQSGKKYPQKPFRGIVGRDASGREFHTWVAMQFAKKNRMEPGFIVPASIKKGGGSPEWWTPALFRRNGWHLIEPD